MKRQLYVLLISACLVMAGCRANQSQPPLFGGGPQQSPGSLFGSTGYGTTNPGFAPGNTQQASNPLNQFANQVGNLNSRLNQFDSDNQNLHAQVAALQQRLQNANSYNDQLRTQLSDQMAQLQQAQLQVQQANARAQQQLAAAQNSNRQVQGQLTSGSVGPPPGQFAGATIRANNSLMQKLQTVQLPGYKAWMDGDVIRIEGPTDRLFVSGTYQLNSNDAATLANLANAIRQNFPRQVIGVEAHWDGTPIQPATTSHHQLTATQALAVFDLLVKSGLPHDQVFTMAVGSNRKRYPVGNAANRRIEIVIYPETF